MNLNANGLRRHSTVYDVDNQYKSYKPQLSASESGRQQKLKRGLTAKYCHMSLRSPKRPQRHPPQSGRFCRAMTELQYSWIKIILSWESIYMSVKNLKNSSLEIVDKQKITLVRQMGSIREKWCMYRIEIWVMYNSSTSCTYETR